MKTNKIFALVLALALALSLCTVNAFAASDSFSNATYGNSIKVAEFGNSKRWSSNEKSQVVVQNASGTDVTADFTITSKQHSDNIYYNFIVITTSAVPADTYTVLKAGTQYGTFTVYARSLSAYDEYEAFSLGTAEYQYDGTAHKPEVSASFTNVAMVPGVDYTVAYEANTNAGEAKAVLTGIGNFTGTLDLPFSIAQKALADDMIQANADQTYTGRAITPLVELADTAPAVITAADYEAVVAADYANNVDVGTATVTVTAAAGGNYTGTASKTFNIVAKDINDIDRLELTDVYVTYDGQFKTPNVIADLNTMGALVKDRDFTVAYADNKDVGTASVTVTGIGNFCGTKVLNFEIQRDRVVHYSGGGTTYVLPASSNMPQVKSGDKNDTVKTLQTELNALGFNCGDVDGVFGSKTYAAVTAFQKARGLTVDGVVGNQTWTALGVVTSVTPVTFYTPVTTTVTDTKATVYVGSTGDNVTVLQTKLNALGYDCGTVDGVFGNVTKTAVMDYQKAMGLTVDGVVGPQTWAKLG